jgi:replicative DNA helicase
MISLTENSYGNAAKSDQEVTLEIIESIKNDDRPFSTGLSRLDKAMDGGMYPGKAYGICARKKVGKTIMAGTISYNLEKAGVKHLFICAEMGSMEIHQRYLSRELEVFPSAFRTDYRNRPDFQAKLYEAAKRYKKNLIYQNAPGITLDQLKLYVARGINNYKIKGFILDYWQLVQGKGKNQSDASHLDAVAQWIAQVCKEHDIWAVVTAQINQEGNTRGGEGIRLAFDQVYTLQCPGDDVTRSDRWMEMNDTRYTAWNNIGSDLEPGLLLEQKGMFFRERETAF